MKNAKKIVAGIAALAMTACTAEKNTVRENVSVTEYSEESSVLTTVSETGSEEEEESLPEKDENMSAAGQAESDVTPVHIRDVVEYALAEGDIDGKQVIENVTSFSMTDLNSDGVDEVFLKYYYGAGLECYVTVYDVSDGIHKLVTLNSGKNDNILYNDKYGDIHYISRTNYFYGSNNYFISYYDLIYTNDGAIINIPLCALPHTWYDNSEFKSEYAVYKDSGYDSDVVDYEYRFIISEDNFIGNYGLDEFDMNGNSDNDRVSELIKQYVFDGLTYIEDLEFTLVSEIEDVSPENKDELPSVSDNKDGKTVTITADTKFYECSYSQENVIDSEDDFDNKDILEKAKEMAFKELSVELKALIEKASDDPAVTEYFSNNPFDISDVKMTQALISDVNGDGENEYALILKRDGFLLPGDNAMTAVLIFVDNKGNFTVQNKKYAEESRLYELQYKGFSHVVIAGGYNNMSHCADFFSFNNGTPKHELNQFWIYGVKDKFALFQYSAQAPSHWLIFWNDEAQCYVTPAAVPLTEAEKDKFKEIMEDTDDRISGYSIGNKFYFVNDKYYEKQDNDFIKLNWDDSIMENKDGYYFPVMMRSEDDYYTVTKASGFDYDTALKNIIPIE